MLAGLSVGVWAGLAAAFLSRRCVSNAIPLGSYYSKGTINPRERGRRSAGPSVRGNTPPARGCGEVAGSDSWASAKLGSRARPEFGSVRRRSTHLFVQNEVPHNFRVKLP
ncbi:hypothetical protein L209DRAFT_543452 [Thermothelomyces heterothallicus CBS 203.75]